MRIGCSHTVVTTAWLSVVLTLPTCFGSGGAWVQRLSNGVPAVLSASGGHVAVHATYLGVTPDGFVYGYDADSSGHEFHVLDPALASPNNAASNAQVALVQFWNTTKQMYLASVSTATKSFDGPSDGLTRTTPAGSFFTWSGGGTASIGEYRFEDVTGAPDGDSGLIARRGTGSTTGGNGSLHKAGLALIGESSPGSDVWHLVGGLTTTGLGSGAPIDRGVRKMEWAALTDLDLVTPAAGTRAVTVGGSLVDESDSATVLITDLVPGIADEVMEMAYHPSHSNLYFVSRYNSGAGYDHVYLSAVAFEWAPTGSFTSNSVATPVDLNSESSDTYLELTYDSGDADPDLFNAIGLAFSTDGSVLYVGTPSDRVWIFDFVASVPGGAVLVVR